MNVLLACEESQAVCKEFRKLGHEAYSCDIQECSGDHPEWHIQNNVLPLLDGHCQFQTADGECHSIEGGWDLIIAFPPCTHLAVSGAMHFANKYKDGRQLEGVWFFAQFLKADCEHIAVENPINIISGEYAPAHFRYHCNKYGFPLKPSQIISPWMFGDPYEKHTCLWIKGLPKLEAEIHEKPEMEYKTWVDKKSGKTKRQPKWFFDALNKDGAERSRIRSKTFPGIARAMAEQWSRYLEEEYERNS